MGLLQWRLSSALGTVGSGVVAARRVGGLLSSIGTVHPFVPSEGMLTDSQFCSITPQATRSPAPGSTP